MYQVEIGEYESSSPQDAIQRLSYALADPAIFEAMLEQLRMALGADHSEWQVTCAGLMCFAAVLVESPDVSCHRTPLGSNADQYSK